MEPRRISQFPSWNHFLSFLRSQDRSNAERGVLFEQLVQRTLQRHPEYQSKLTNVWLLSEVPSRVRGRLNLPRQDEGIDLIAETVDRDYWAIQCKFKSDSNTSVTRTELSTFSQLAFAHCKKISFGLVFHTSEQPIRKLGLLGGIGARGRDFFDQLSDEDWTNIVAERSRPLQPRKPRKHQQDAVRAARRHYSEKGAVRGKLIMPCGTGKSLTAFWLSEALEAKSILVAVPSLSLIKQSLADWTREFIARGVKPDWLVVCSDESAARRERDEFTESIGDLGIDATTNPDRIQAFLKKRPGVRIVFSTYQSGSVLAREASKQNFKFDLGIFDEAHRTVGIEDKLFSHLLSDANISIRKRLFMTATERVVRGSKDDVYSMDDHSVYGDCFYQMTFRQAIEANPPIICDYKIITVSVTDAEIEELIRERHFVSVLGMKEDQRADALVAAIAINKVIKKFGAKHLISFHRSIQAADSFRELQSKVFNASKQKISTFHISSKKSAGERASLIQEFRESPKALITNARCLQEGVDIPAVDTVVFADPKQSVVDIVQAAGRAMRRFDGKTFGMIVLPLPVPDKVDPEVFFEGTEFRHVARVISALSTQDQRIAEEFRVIEQQPRSKAKIVEMEFDLPLTEKIGLEDFSRQIFLRVWKKVGRVNWRPFHEARDFVRSQKIASTTDWRDWSKSTSRPLDIPVSPDTVYVEFVSWGDWLGTDRRGRYSGSLRSFADARAFVRALSFKTAQEYQSWARGPEGLKDIPTSPDRHYEDWVSWPDWLGNGNRSRREEYLAFEDARDIIRKKRFRSSTEYLDWAKLKSKPHNIPASPHTVYSEQWEGWSDWLGAGWRSFAAARTWARSQGLKGHLEWVEYLRTGSRPVDIPSNPSEAYHEHWGGWKDWLDTERWKGEKFLSFSDGRAIARGLGLKSQSEYLSWWRENGVKNRLPNTVTKVYESEWRGWEDWLGFDRWRSFSKAREFVRGLGLKSINEWRAFTKTREFPRDIPKAPEQAAVYADQWISYSDWLGEE
jgi:superfamily II DNA or RNA helicase